MESTITKIELLSIWKENIGKFIHSLSTLFPSENDLILTKMFIDQIPTEQVLLYFSEKILPLRKQIEIRDENFFLNDDNTFMGVSETKVVKWKKLWNSSVLDNNDKNAIWQWMDLFVKISDKYRQLHS